MKFANIDILFLIWAVPAVALFFLYGMKKREKILKRYAAPGGLASICPETDSARRWVKNVLLLACLLFSAVAAAGPQYGFEWEKIERKGVDIILAVDCSKSMLAEDIKPSRLDRAKREILDLVSILKGDRVGLVAFAGTAFLQCPLTLDHGGFPIFLDVLSPGFLPVGGTDLSGAIETALSGFDEKDKTEKAIILITDGESTVGDPMEAAEAAAEAGVKLFCIGVGSPEGVPVPDEKGGFQKDRDGAIVLTKLDENQLKQMALSTGGAYARSVSGDMDLDLIYEREIRGKMRAETLAAGKKKIWQDRFQWPLFLALVAFSIEMLISSVNPKKTGLAAIVFWMAVCLPAPGEAMAEGAHEKTRKGIEAYNSEEYEKALEHFIGAQLEEPERPETAYNLGAAYYKLGDHEKAEKHFARALRSESVPLRAKTRYNMGNAYFRRQNLEKAVENYEAALKLDPEDKQAAANLEFSKKLLEQQRQQQSESGEASDQGDKNGDKREESSGDRQNEDESNQEDQRKQAGADSPEKREAERDAPESGEKKPAGAANDAKQEGQEKQAAGAEENENQGEKKARAQAQADKVDRSQAEAMLNRLEDKPGKALMPAYGETKVLKDW